MPDCEMLEKCIFFNDKMENMPDTAEIIKNYYCRKFYHRCARYVFKKISGEVSQDLFPDDMKEVSRRFGWEIEK